MFVSCLLEEVAVRCGDAAGLIIPASKGCNVIVCCGVCLMIESCVVLRCVPCAACRALRAMRAAATRETRTYHFHYFSS